jgi:hypothetical protein
VPDDFIRTGAINMRAFLLSAASVPRIVLASGLGLLLVLSPFMSLGPVDAQEQGQVEILTGRIDAGEIIIYRLPDLQQGQRLFIYAAGTSSDLDPIVGLLDGSVDPEAVEAAFEDALARAAGQGLDPLAVTEELRDRFLLAWDDDGGGGLDAALEYQIPADGEYRLLIAGALSALGGASFGHYEMTVGLDAPQVLEGNAEPTGQAIAIVDKEATPPGAGVYEVTGSLTQEKPSTFLILHDFDPEDTIYAYMEATSGDLAPVLVLQNFARKPVRSANLNGTERVASIQYTFPGEATNYRLVVNSWHDGERATAGDYRLLVGVNTPEVLNGQAQTGGRPVVREPVEVKIGLKLQQIVDVNQANEFFTAVGSLQMEWVHPGLAFNPSDCQCSVKTFTGNSFDEFMKQAEGKWPEFTFENQQGNRWSQNQVAVVWSDGHALYFERFTTSFQVDFDFRRFPFDTQRFPIRVDALFPEEYQVFSDLEGFTEISTEHGEDEFIITGFDTQITSETSSTGSVTSRFTFSFSAPRHINYYIFQVFTPILLIIIVSWITFFLKDYGRRIEVASANLLLFIAFSWSLSDNYPRLGYLTFLDAVMAIMFVVNAFVVAYNVWLRRLEMNGQGERAERIDTVLDWAYPLGYVLLFGVVIWHFF